MTLTDALFDEYTDGVFRAAVAALATAFPCVGGGEPRPPFWAAVEDLRRTLDAGRVYFEPDDFLARFRSRKTRAFDYTGRPHACDCLETLVWLALLDDRDGCHAAACVGVLKAEHLPAARDEFFAGN